MTVRGEIYASDGLRVSEVRRHWTRPRRGVRAVSVEVLVVGGEWTLSESEARKLHVALGKWLEGGEA